MDSALQALISINFLFAALGIAGFNFVLRKITEFVLANFLSKDILIHKIWTDVLMPISPIVTGFFAGFFIQNFIYPEDIKTKASRIVFGIVAGMFSGLVYRVGKSILVSKLPQEQQDKINAEDKKLDQ